MTTTELIKLLESHIAQMAPHQRQRTAGTLLVESLSRIKKLDIELQVFKKDLIKNTQELNETRTTDRD